MNSYFKQTPFARSLFLCVIMRISQKITNRTRTGVDLYFLL